MQTEKSVPIIRLNIVRTVFRADIVVNNKYILVPKATTTKLSYKDKSQFNQLIKIINISTRILVNFIKALGIKEVVL